MFSFALAASCAATGVSSIELSVPKHEFDLADKDGAGWELQEMLAHGNHILFGTI